MTARLANEFTRIALALQGAPFALVGGLAVSTRTEPRFTRDIDLAVAVGSDVEAEAIVAKLTGQGYRVFALVEQDAMRRLATARLEAPEPDGRGLVLDLLFASSGIESEVARDAERLQILPDLEIPVAQVGHLIALKLLACDDRTRPQDAADLVALLRVADDCELDRARAAVELIVSRGFHRGRDLRALLGVSIATRELAR